jgi:hypothetical protein
MVLKLVSTELPDEGARLIGDSSTFNSEATQARPWFSFSEIIT